MSWRCLSLMFVLAFAGCASPGSQGPRHELDAVAEAGVRDVSEEAPVEGDAADAPPALPTPRQQKYRAQLVIGACANPGEAPCPAVVLEESIPIFAWNASDVAALEAAGRDLQVVATWTPGQPLAQVIQLAVTKRSGETVAAAGGESPLVLTLPRAALAPGEEYLVEAWPGTGVAFVDQVIEILAEPAA